MAGMSVDMNEVNASVFHLQQTFGTGTGKRSQLALLKTLNQMRAQLLCYPDMGTVLAGGGGVGRKGGVLYVRKNTGATRGVFC